MMVIKAKKGFYDNLSRKELQNMCKLYGLPANKSHTELEKSLLAYSEKASHSKCKGRAMNYTKAQRKSSNEKLLSFSREDMVDFRPHEQCRDKDDGQCCAETAFASPFEKSAKVRSSSFEFHVRSDEGINLYVDLNSSPSDWAEKVKNEVHKFENVHNNKSRSLHEDLGCLKEGDKEMRNPYWNVSAGEIRDGHIETPFSPSSEKDKTDQSKICQPEKGEMSLIPLVMQTCSVSVDVSDKSTEDQSPKACRLNSNLQDRIISVADSCANAGCAVVCNSDVITASDDSKSIYGTPVNSLSDGPSIRVSLEHTITNLSRCQKTILQYDSSLPNPAVVDPGCSVSSSMEIQSSDVGSCNKDASYLNCDNGGPMGGFDPKHTVSEKSVLANSSPDVYGSHLPALAEEGERSNMVNERESSECSQFTKASEKTFVNSDKLDSREGLQKKRKHIESEHQSGYANANVKILKSVKHSTRKDSPRRSMRLLSK